MKASDPQSFDHLAEMYDRATSLERKHDFFLQNLPERRRNVLDVGCGTGLLALELSGLFESVTAIDISEPMIAIARRKRPAPNIEYRIVDANEAAFQQKFDAIVSHTTFHHIKNVPETLRLLKAAVAPGGRLILVDLINRWPLFIREMTAFYVLLATAAIPSDIFRHGIEGARLLFRFRISRPWLDHLKSDRYLSPADFREVYGNALPGASFTHFKYFAGVVWQAPESRAPSDPAKKSLESRIHLP